MSDPATLITQFVTFSGAEDSENAAKYASSLADLISTNKLSFLQFIQLLGSRITSSIDEDRTKGMRCLAAVLHEITSSSSALSKHDINVLVDFLLTKFSDKPCFADVIKALTNILHAKAFSPSLNDNLVKILRKVVDEYDSSVHLARGRYEVFALLQTALTRFRDAITTRPALHDLYVQAFLHVSNGEKDPRNLLISFDLNKNINHYFRFEVATNELHKHFVEELFDTCFCYFPISFRPPPNDPYKITSEQLKTSLRSTLTSQFLFAKDLFNNLFEKLASTNPVIRNDVLLTLLSAVDSFHEDTILEYWETIWNGLKFEILHSENTNIFSVSNDRFIPENIMDLADSDENKSLYLVLEILSRMATRLDDEDGLLPGITSDLKEYLSITSKVFMKAVILLSSMATASERGFNYIQQFIFQSENLGKFISGFDDTDDNMETDISLTVARQRDLIDAFGYILISYQVLSSSLPNASFFFESNYLSQVKDSLVVFLGQLLQASSTIEKTLKCKIIQQYIKLIQLRRFLSYEEKHVIMELLNDMFFELIEEAKPDDLIVDEIMKGLINLTEDGSDQNNQLIVDVFLPQVLQQIDPQNQKLSKYVEVLDSVVVSSQLLEVVSIRLVNRLSNDRDFNSKIIELLGSLVMKVQKRSQFLMNSWFKGIVPKLLNQAAEVEASGVNNSDNWHYLELISVLLGFVIKYYDSPKHQGILDDFQSAFYKNKAKSGLKLSGYTILEVASPMVLVFNNVLSNIDKSTNLSIQLEDLVRLIETTSNLRDPILKVNYLQHLCLLVNKFYKDDDSLQPVVEKLYDLQQPSNFEISVWIIKALMLRLSKVGIEYLTKLLEVLDHDASQATIVLRSFDIILRDLKIFSPNKELPKGSKIISKVNHLNTRSLYKQQVFNIVLAKVLQQPENEIHLQLLAVLTKNIDSHVLKSRINDIIPLTIQSIQLNTLLDTSLETLLIIIDSNNLQNFMPLLVKRLMVLSNTKVVENNRIVNTERIRYLSLKCLLELLRTNDKSTILLYKPEMLVGLVTNLDDPRRSIRKLSCDIRQLLFEAREST
ncbi:hypothetical protein PSN45_004680 [Yamadazyma tenuis]|uniref:MMS19 nucleotide excision repair protein n=1 Tax=Candida tenuis (strain ATCC 10573 / BCRC 21748 / CBS 615 / JCM 9827 / NBRC 10315 / NRRL Y-1498 / VKM Y-70) TaxID=590646 RepID=G3B6Y6_CANTC|nr:uncharacterized protein CANTEDRAFT_106041 [Yamadazyma tenuis ATCC 10573]EGV63050.1 hypothetical protein CANTEDRAFT_106041 [Yamadazyma tenuis ATCC 10573]WEJ97132.1 hypothetical protein PSN45_004680 [Yamadazyma tenuis]